MSGQLLNDLSLFAPETAITVTLVLAVLADLVFRRRPRVVSFLVLAGFLVTGALLVGEAHAHASIFSGMVAVDAFALFFKGIVVAAGILVVVFSMESGELNSAGRSMGEYYALLCAAALGMMVMAGANNLLMMYIALELSSLSSYLLTGYTREASDSSEASLKYLIYGAVSSGLMLYGISLIYGLTGGLGLAAVNHALPAVLARGDAATLTLLIATVLALAGLGYKISAVPFHFWTPDVYEGAPVTITAFLSVASKAGGFAMLIRFFKVAFIDTAAVSLPAGTWATLQGVHWVDLVAILAVLSMTIGNLIAVWQDNLKRLLAYSSIAHAGYMLSAVVVLSNDGLSAIMVYFAVYLFMNLGAFYAVMLIADRTGSEDINEYRGLGARSPFLAVALAIFLVSLTGLPPTAGFVGKLYIFAALIRGGWTWLAIVGALNSVIALYYYVRVFRNMFLQPVEPKLPPLSLGWAQNIAVLVMLVPTLLLGLYFTPLVQLAQASVSVFGTP
ncbi:MAG TPA: NADH-quinone oxidoreductase subunit N [Bacteroidota bacterium]|nr:NADH-quinone oxidoreductase subunit N [Bacteroidota bacterium]